MPAEISKEAFARTRAAIEKFGLGEIHHDQHQPIIMAALDLAVSASSPEPDRVAKLKPLPPREETP